MRLPKATPLLLLFIFFHINAEPAVNSLDGLVRWIGRLETQLARQVQASAAQTPGTDKDAVTLDSLKHVLRGRVAERMVAEPAMVALELEQALREFPGSPLLLSLLADVEMSREHFQHAKDLYRQALAVDASDPDLQRKVGAVLVRLGEDASALRVYRALAEQVPNDAACLRTCLELAGRTGRLEEVARRWEVLVRAHPGYAVMRRHLVAAWNRLGRNDKVVALTGDGGGRD